MEGIKNSFNMLLAKDWHSVSDGYRVAKVALAAIMCGLFLCFGVGALKQMGALDRTVSAYLCGVVVGVGCGLLGAAIYLMQKEMKVLHEQQPVYPEPRQLPRAKAEEKQQQGGRKVDLQEIEQLRKSLKEKVDELEMYKLSRSGLIAEHRSQREKTRVVLEGLQQENIRLRDDNGHLLNWNERSVQERQIKQQQETKAQQAVFHDTLRQLVEEKQHVEQQLESMKKLMAKHEELYQMRRENEALRQAVPDSPPPYSKEHDAKDPKADSAKAQEDAFFLEE